MALIYEIKKKYKKKKKKRARRPIGHGLEYTHKSNTTQKSNANTGTHTTTAIPIFQ
jgi:hypothetical protein